MKRFVIFLALLIPFLVFAQASFIFEDFEVWPPTDWLLNPTSGESAWVQSPIYSQDYISPQTGASRSYSAEFSSYDYPAGDLGDMISPAVNLAGATSPVLDFYFWNHTDQIGYGNSDSIIVCISNDNGGSWVVLDTLKGDVDVWTEHSYDLSSYINDTVMVKFTGVSDYGGSNMGIDAVRLGEPPNYDVGIIAILSPTSSVLSNNNITPECIVKNYGKKSADDFYTYLMIDSAGVNIYRDSVFTSSLLSGGEDTINFALWNVGGGEGIIYNLTFRVALSLDEVLSNDTAFTNTQATVFSELRPFGSGMDIRCMSWGDYDDDGDIDMAVGNSSFEGNYLFKNEFIEGYSDSFSQISAFDSGQISSIIFGDYNNDGNLDVMVSNFGGQNRLYKNNGDGTFTELDRFGTGNNNGISWGDYDNDGDLDLALGKDGEQNKLFRNEFMQGYPDSFTEFDRFGVGGTYEVCWGDYDNDGDLDLAVANYDGQNKLYRNEFMQGYPDSFTELNKFGADQSRTIVWYDIDNDGDLDIIVGNDGQNKLYRNEFVQGYPDSFTEFDKFGGIGFQPNEISVGDYNNDGYPDVAVGNYNAQNKLYNNNGDGTFTEYNEFGTGNTFSLAWGDYNNDGDLDLAVGNRYETNKLYRNDGNYGNYINVKTIGKGITGYSNKSGIGAKVYLYYNWTDTLVGYQEIGIRGFRGITPLEAHFGTPPGHTYDVIVYWPASGIRDGVRGITPPANITIVEGESGITEDRFKKKSNVFKIEGPCPNPFRKQTLIRYYIPGNKPVDVSINIYNISGQLVKILVNSRVNPGIYTAIWRGNDTYGKKVSTGIYFVYTTFNGGQRREYKKIIFVR